MEGLGARSVVFDGDHFPAMLGCEKILDGWVMNDFEIFVGTHGATAVVFFLADDMNFAHIKRVGGADDGADIEIVFDVLDGDFEG